MVANEFSHADVFLFFARVSLSAYVYVCLYLPRECNYVVCVQVLYATVQTLSFLFRGLLHNIAADDVMNSCAIRNCHFFTPWENQENTSQPDAKQIKHTNGRNSRHVTQSGLNPVIVIPPPGWKTFHIRDTGTY